MQQCNRWILFRYNSQTPYYETTFNTISQRPGPEAGQDLSTVYPTEMVNVMRMFLDATVTGIKECMKFKYK